MTTWMIAFGAALLLTLCVFFPGQCRAQSETATPQPRSLPEMRIVNNQVGYLPHWPKVAFLLGEGDVSQEAAQLVNVATEQSVMNIVPGPVYKDPQSGDHMRALDFSTITTPGRYYVRYRTTRSTNFAIDADVYQEPLRVMLHSYYVQRCGVAVDDPDTHVRHAACHLRDATLAHHDPYGEKGAPVSTVGGWHDAGDYGKYVTTTAVTIGRLLNLYEQYPALFPDQQLRIPESGNGISDLLDEVRVGMEWLRSMQRADGAVYRKLSGMTWPKALLPEKDEQPRFLFGISTPETAKFAAVAAMTARVFQSIDPEFATACLDAAQRAWRYVRSHPAMQADWVAGDDQGSGKYLSSEVDQEPALLTDVDDRLWAATELLLTTHDARFYRYIRHHVPQFAFTLFEWKDPSPLALLTYLEYSTARGTDPRGTRHITQQLLRRANRVLQTVTRSGYHIANDRFVWGSNKMTAEEGITLFYAYKLTGNAAYRNAAIDQIDYLLGRNHFGLSFVSGIGENAVQHVCHLFAHAAGIPIPGLLVGGPNEEAQCGIAPKGLGSLSYIDHADSYATNEYAIDYNASAIALMAMLVGEAGTQGPVSH